VLRFAQHDSPHLEWEHSFSGPYKNIHWGAIKDVDKRIGQRLTENECSQPRAVICCHPSPREGSLSMGREMLREARRGVTVPVLVVKVHYRRWAAINDSVGKFSIHARLERECHSHLSLGNHFPNRVINRRLRSDRCILSMGKIGPLRICTQTLEKLHYGRHEKDILVISQNSHGK